MKNTLRSASLSLTLCTAALLASFPSAAEDTDIYKAAPSNATAPNILIVLDNTSNWARQSQQWPGGVQQGQSEANAIKSVLSSFDSTTKVNLGLMEFVTNGNANDNGGFVRYNISDMSNSTNIATFKTKLTTIYNNITSPNEKRNSRTPYGNLMYDVYNYFAGANSFWGQSAMPSPDVDPNGYTTNYSQFKSPLSASASCAKTYVIFIGNPNSSGPSADDDANTRRLAALGGDTTQLPLPGVTTSTTISNAVSTTLGNTSACYGTLAAAQAAYGYGLNVADNICQLYGAKGSAASPGALSSPDKYSNQCYVYSNGTSNTVVATALDFQNQCATYTEGCKFGSQINNPTTTQVTTGTTGYYASAPAATAADAGAKAGLTCPADAISCTYTVDSGTPATGATALTGILSNNCYWTGSGSQPSGFSLWGASTNDFGNAACPANYTCTYTQTGTSDPGNQCTTARTKRAVLNQVLTPLKYYTVTQTATILGGVCPANTNQYTVLGTNLVQTNVFNTTTFADTLPMNADEWARFMFQKGVQIGTDNSGNAIREPVAMYTIDVYNAQPNALHTSLLTSMAKNGGGKYFAAQNEDQIVKALKTILAEIQAVNSTFASASLPVNATNRTQNLNQVFIGMFRPDTKPRWFGNLKRYQLINSAGTIALGDNDQPPKEAVNPATGFITDCAISYWSTDSTNYWQNVNDGTQPVPQLLDPTTVRGTCPGAGVYSDLPDGPLVEKGAVAEVLRKGNNPTGAATWSVNRTIYTRSGNNLVAFNTSNSGLSASLVDFISGHDINDEQGTGSTTTSATNPRPSIHGDVVHSRPLPINYGGDNQVVVYYGANDGMLRAVDASTGKEKWAFIAPEFFDSRLNRLMANSPNDNVPAVYPNDSNNKDYFFDGSIGFYQNADNSNIWIFPTMRRGGRMVYAFDVRNPDSPTLKWAAGCPNLVGDTGCTTGMTGIGQTWSVPRATRIKGYSTTSPLLIFGGGYDTCEDANTATPSCSSAKGNAVYILNADTGAIVRTFTFTGGRSIAADVTPIDVDGDGYADYAYAADTGGNVYRIDFVDFDKTPRSQDNWTARRVAYTSGAGRKFEFGPAVFATSGVAYLAIGSGDREHPLSSHYPFTGVVNRFYVYKDDLSVNAANATAVNMDTMTDLTANTTCNATPILPTSSGLGWYMNLNQYGTGEQTVTSALIAGGMVNFSTNRPVTDPNACNPQLGEARGYAVNLFTRSGGIGVTDTCGGATSGVITGGGLPPSPVLTTVPVDGKNVTICIGCANSTSGNSDFSTPKVKYLVQPKRKRVYSFTKGDN